MNFNEYLWHCINALGFWFWLPFGCYGAYGLNKLYRMAPAETATGRWARILLVTAFLTMLFSLRWPALRLVCGHLLALGVCLILRQAYAACAAVGKIKKPDAPTFIERLAQRMATHKVTSSISSHR